MDEVSITMNHKVSRLTGGLLDAAVAKALGIEYELDTLLFDGSLHCWKVLGENDTEIFSPTRDWAIGGPIMADAQLYIEPPPLGANYWSACHHGQGEVFGFSMLEAAMRAIAMRKFGDEVEL